MRDEARKDRPEWSDITEWQARENERLARAAEKPSRDDTYAADAKWDLDDLRTVLDFEARHHPTGRKSDLIARHFKTTPTRYFQRLNQHLDTEEAVAYAPALVQRLNRLRTGMHRTGTHTAYQEGTTP